MGELKHHTLISINRILHCVVMSASSSQPPKKHKLESTSPVPQKCSNWEESKTINIVIYCSQVIMELTNGCIVELAGSQVIPERIKQVNLSMQNNENASFRPLSRKSSTIMLPTSN